MRSIPKCFRGAYVAAVRVSVHEILDAMHLETFSATCAGGSSFSCCQVVVVQSFKGRSGVEAAVARAHGFVQRRRCFSKATALQRQELKQQCGSVINMFKTTFLGEQ